MKTLILMKHAKARLDGKILDDWYRPLSKQGAIDARQIGKMLLSKNIIPEIIITSSAIRAQRTAEIVADVFNLPCNFCSLDSLYLAEMEVYYQEIQKLPDEVNCALVVGHGPSLDYILQVLTEKVETIPTFGAACVAASIDTWKDFKYDVKGQLIHLVKVTPTTQLLHDRNMRSEMASTGLSASGQIN